MRVTKLLKSGEIPEETIQKAIIDWTKLIPKINGLVLHFANEGKRTRSYGRLLKDIGMRRGVSDLFIAMPNHGFCGAWIEIKSLKGVLSIWQKQFLEDMQAQNYYISVCRSVDEGIETIKWYCSI